MIQFISRKKELSKLTDVALAEINNLCFEYYGTRLAGEETPHS